MTPRHRADAVGREELGLVEHHRQDALQALPRGDRQQAVVVAAARLQVADGLRQVGTVGQEPLHAPLEAGQGVDLVLLDDLAGDQRHEPHQRAHAQRDRAAVHVELVVVEAVVVAPQAVAAQAVHGVGDGHEVLEELAGHVLVGGVVARQLERDGQHRAAVEGHPGRAVGLVELPAAGQRGRAVEHADVVEPQEPAGEHVPATAVLAVHPPGEVQQQLVEHALEEGRVARPGRTRLLVHAPAGPGVHRRVHVAQRPLVGGHLPVGVHVPLAQHQLELVLGEVLVDAREGQHVEGQVPGRVPGVLPLVGHREDVAVVQVRPPAVAALATARRRRGLGRVALQPVRHHVMVELLRPDQAGVGLARHPALLGVETSGLARGVEGVGLGAADGEHLGEVRARPGGRRVVDDVRRAGPQAQQQHHLASRGQLEPVQPRRLGAGARHVDRLAAAVHDVVVEGVLDPGRGVLGAEQPGRVGLVLGEQQLGRPLGTIAEDQLVVAQVLLPGAHTPVAHSPQARPGSVLFAVATPAPHVAEPERGQHPQRRRLGPAVRERDAHGHVLGRGLGVVDPHVEVAVVVEDARVGQLVLAVRQAAPARLLHQLRVGEGRLGVLVERRQPAVGGRGVEVVVGLLHVLAVVALGTGEAEQALLQDRVAPVPQRQREGHAALAVAQAEQPVLAPAIGTAARLVVGERVPGRAVLGVVLAHGAPLPLRQVGTPALPVGGARGVVRQALLFGSAGGGMSGGGGRAGHARILRGGVPRRRRRCSAGDRCDAAWRSALPSGAGRSPRRATCPASAR